MLIRTERLPESSVKEVIWSGSTSNANKHILDSANAPLGVVYVAGYPWSIALDLLASHKSLLFKS